MQISRQEQIDKIMCKPGYTWSETLERCLGGGAVLPEDGETPTPPTPEPKPKPKPKPTPDEAIQQEIASRESTGEVA